jgi:hypothetical protein
MTVVGTKKVSRNVVGTTVIIFDVRAPPEAVVTSEFMLVM